jgi:Zn-dependent protease with chaperone function
MKVIPLLLGLFILTVTSAIAQPVIALQTEIHAEAMSKIYPNIKKGDTFKITAAIQSKDIQYADYGYMAFDAVGNEVFIDASNTKALQFSSANSIIAIWHKHMVMHDVLPELMQKGYQYDLRNDLNTESNDFINSLSQQGGFFNDAYLEDYLYALISKIHGGVWSYNRPGNLSIRILKDTEPNAFILPNGAMVISTGLLSTIKSEDELAGILAHEIAHFVLDHHVINYNKEIDRQKRAEFWAALATVAAAGADAYLSMNNEYHVPGVLTASTIIAATVLTDQITKRLGIKYSQEQESKADLAATEVISSLSYDKSGLAIALYRLRSYFVKTGDFLALSGSGTHPSIESRIQAIGMPEITDQLIQPKYLKSVSLVNSHNAWIELWSRNQPLAALALVNSNIENGVGTEVDYIVAAVVKRRQAVSNADLEEVLKLLAVAKALNVAPHIQISKEEGLTYLRLNKPAEAKQAFVIYLDELQQFKAQFRLSESQIWLSTLVDEIDWAQKMVFKADKL